MTTATRAREIIEAARDRKAHVMHNALLTNDEANELLSFIAAVEVPEAPRKGDSSVLTLEVEVADLRRRLVAVEERVRLDTAAQEFLRNDPRVREGDYCLIDGLPTRVDSISSEGKWTYHNGRNQIEPFRVPPSDDIHRLYTVAEVTEIVAKVIR